MGRNRVLVVGLGIVVAASGGGWAAGQRIQSPADVAAKTAPPKASLISVPVKKTTLTSDVVVRGTVRYGAPRAVSLPKSALKPGSAIVTTAPIKGAALAESDVVLTLSGRPVLVLQGAQAAYRDLGPGAQGTDVQQLEDALARLGYDPGPKDGLYDHNTSLAVAAWYRAKGWTPFAPTSDQTAAARTADADLMAARLERLTAEETRATAGAALSTADADIATKQAAVDAAVDAETLARLDLQEGRAGDPPPSPAKVASLESTARQATVGIRVARSGLDAANVTSVRSAEAVRVAERRVEVTANREAALSATVADLTAKLDVQVPANEVLFFPTLPLRVDDVTAKSGEETTGPLMTVTNSQLSVDAAVGTNDARLIRKGLGATIEEPQLAVRAQGLVSDLAGAPGTQGVDPTRYYLQVTPADAPISLAGASVLVTIRVGSTQGEVLAVPVAALSVGANGASRVQVVSSAGASHDIVVTPGLASKGLVAVTPVGGDLRPGDLVVVGRATNNNRSPSPPTSKP